MLEGNLFRSCAGVAAVAIAIAQPAGAQNVSAPGYIYSFIDLSDSTQSCVAAAPGGTFVGAGPGFTGNAQSIVFVSESGVERTVVSGFNSLGDCLYDVASDILFAVDNGLEAAGSVTGDTAYGIPGALGASNLAAAGFTLAAAGALPNASAIALDAAGDLFVSESAASGSGAVRKIAASNGALTTFASGFDFAGGLVWDTAGDLFVAESLDSFQSQISRYSATGAFEEVVSGPSFAHGSYDLAINLDGRLVVTGVFNGPVVSINPDTGNAFNLATGFTFATSIDVDEFTGRIKLVSSTFSGADEDSRLHVLTPVELIVPDGGPAALGNKSRGECVSALYGVHLASNPKGKPSKKAVCTDGAACDDDAAANGQCTFPLGVCLNIDDDRTPNCESDAAVSFGLKKAKPANAAVSALVAAIEDAVPVDGPRCFFSDGVVVPLRTGKKGGLKLGKQVVKIKSETTSPVRGKDTDAVILVCEPSAG